MLSWETPTTATPAAANASIWVANACASRLQPLVYAEG